METPYDPESEELAAAPEGAPELPELPPYELRAPMYRDLVRLLVPGFLSATCHVDGHAYALRSLHPGDLFALTSVVRSTSPEWRMWVVAASLWAVDGVFLFESGSSATRAAYDALRASSPALINQLFGTCVGFFRRARAAHRYLEAYLYEDESRRLWESTCRGRYPIWTRSPLPGLERLGFNPFQASWMAWNHLEDLRLDQDHAWSLTKVQVALQSAKSYQKLESRDTARAESQEAVRRASLLRAYDHWRGLIDDEGKALDGSTPRVTTPRTPLELAEEMKKWMSGDLDAHDRVIEEYKERIRLEYEARNQALEEARVEAEVRRAAPAAAGRPRLVSATPAELAERLGSGTGMAVRVLHEEHPGTRLFNRYLKEEPGPGHLTVGADGKVSLASSTPLEAARFSVNDLLADRVPVLAEDDG